MDARRRGAAKVGTLASRATRQTLQLTQPNKIRLLRWTGALLCRWSAHGLRRVASHAAGRDARHKSAPGAHARLDQCFPRGEKMSHDYTETLITSRTAYQGKLLTLKEDQVKLPDGNSAT